MNDPIINLITQPDKLLNSNPSLLLVNLDHAMKLDFNDLAKNLTHDINVYMHDDTDSPNIQWLIENSNNVDYIVMNIDLSKEQEWLVGYLLSFGKTFYLTKADNIMYNVINNNRIFDIKQFAERTKFFDGIQQ